MLTGIHFTSRVVYPHALLTSYNLHFTRQECFFNYHVSKLFNRKIQNYLLNAQNIKKIIKCLNSVKCKG